MTRTIASVVVAVVASATLAVAPAGAGRAAPHGHGLGPAPVDEVGPWGVGYETFEITDPARGDRTLPVDVWYPVDPADTVGVPPAEIDLVFAEVAMDVARDAPEPAGVGHFPLVVFSHGSGGVRFQSWDLMEHLASKGFVVVAPDHVGNTALDPLLGTSLPFATMARYRPLDVSFVIDEMLALDATPGHRYRGLIDQRKIAVAGHSFGGFTSLAVAGGYADVPADDRVDAIIVIAGASTLISDAQLRSIDIPTLFLSATLDRTVPLDPGTTRPWELISSRRAFRVDVLDGGHSSFTNVCDIVDVLAGAGLPEVLLDALAANAAEACGPELIDIDEALRLTNLYSGAFLGSALREPGWGWSRLALTGIYARWQDLNVDLHVGLGPFRWLVYEGPEPVPGDPAE